MTGATILHKAVTLARIISEDIWHKSSPQEGSTSSCISRVFTLTMVAHRVEGAQAACVVFVCTPAVSSQGLRREQIIDIIKKK
jgi:hypothetical protein